MATLRIVKPWHVNNKCPCNTLDPAPFWWIFHHCCHRYRKFIATMAITRFISLRVAYTYYNRYYAIYAAKILLRPITSANLLDLQPGKELPHLLLSPRRSGAGRQAGPEVPPQQAPHPRPHRSRVQVPERGLDRGHLHRVHQPGQVQNHTALLRHYWI